MTHQTSQTLIIMALSGALAGTGVVLCGLTDTEALRSLLAGGGLSSAASGLAFAFVSGLLVAMVGIRIGQRRKRPVLSPIFHSPTRRTIDVRLVLGALLFGIGAGLSGLLPGAAVASLAIAPLKALAALLVMALGMRCVDIVLHEGSHRRRLHDRMAPRGSQ
ncbi:putative transporter component [Hartmannibacter diazotrophicus]|uniref:Putative transporter component n=1 Tax=Hartmannibacter diazotrophicus TaxID=1482074 RepID=A0A2C9D6X8_9HYPH|nr:DUF6691 family protein [Hartmannibacter diazotrophicus]SON56003.1 putative transporter component [Hartmannibacter diazotrophicus]